MSLSGLSWACVTYAQPILIEGKVPNEPARQEILAKMYANFGQENVIDRIQVGKISAPDGWSETVTRVINQDLKKIKQGQLKVKGSTIELNGKLLNSNDIDITRNKFQTLIPSDFRLSTQLSVDQAEQHMVNAALKNRIIEFESGSAVLAASGIQILNEMLVALNQVKGKKVKIIGHTDSSGEASKNLLLSQQRAEAVRDYLINKNIAAEILSVEG